MDAREGVLGREVHEDDGLVAEETTVAGEGLGHVEQVDVPAPDGVGALLGLVLDVGDLSDEEAGLPHAGVEGDSGERRRCGVGGRRCRRS